MEERKSNIPAFYDHALKALTFLAAALIVLFLFPENSKYKYQFELDKPWQYDLLTAPYDFAIYKSKDEMKSEREAIISRNIPYFNIDTKVEKVVDARLDELEAHHKALYTANKRDSIAIPNITAYTQYLRGQFDDIFEQGLMSTSDYSRFSALNVEMIVVTDGNKQSSNQAFSELFTPTKAKTRIYQNLPDKLTYKVLNRINLDELFMSNLIYNEELTNQIKEEELKNVSPTFGMVQEGERIIDRGEIVTNQKFKILDSMRRASEDREQTSAYQHMLMRIGQVVLAICLIALFYFYLLLFRKKFYVRYRNILLLLSLILIFVAMTAMVTRYGEGEYVNAIPYALLPMIVSTFFDTRTGLFAHLITILLASFMVPTPTEFFLLQITTGMVTILSMKDFTKRSQLVQSAFFIMLIYSTMYTGYNLISDINNISWHNYAMFLTNSIATMLAYPLIFFCEKAFGFTSNMSLLELTNINNPLLRQLAESAPGTFQHSLQVSNLATEIASKINANVLLARTGALYHDIGKMRNPVFFTENQASGINPHDQLNPEESAQIITRHVDDGVAIAKENNLPDTIIDFIISHHGKGVATFFYNTWINKHPGEEIDIAKFSYSGTNPTTKEQAIVMLCDAVEAASHSLSEYTDESINNLVDNIIDGIVSSHRLDYAPITLKQVTLIKQVLKDKLKNIYHTRIAYPEIKKDGDKRRKKKNQ